MFNTLFVQIICSVARSVLDPDHSTVFTFNRGTCLSRTPILVSGLHNVEKEKNGYRAYVLKFGRHRYGSQSCETWIIL